MLSTKNIIKILLNTILGILLVFLWSKFVDLGEIFTTLARVDLRFVVAFFGFFVLSGVLRGLRLKLLLKQYKIPTRDVIPLIFLGQFLNFVIPIRAGEIAKGVYLSKNYTLPFSKTLTWIFIDRFLDFWVVLLTSGVLLFIIPTNFGSNFRLIVGLAFAGFSIAAVLAILSQNLARSLVARFSKFLYFTKFQKFFSSFCLSIIDSFSVLKRGKKDSFGLILLTVLATISDGLIWVVLFLSLQSNFGFLKPLLGNSLWALSFLVPAAPGYVGSLEASSLAVFSFALGLPVNIVSAATVLNHILTLVAVLILGVGSIYFLKFDLSSVWKKLKKE